jgi:hypothetical protein
MYLVTYQKPRSALIIPALIPLSHVRIGSNARVGPPNTNAHAARAAVHEAARDGLEVSGGGGEAVTLFDK